MNIVTDIEAPPEKATLEALGKGLDGYNSRFMGRVAPSEFVTTARDETGAFKGGIFCVVYGPTLFVKWVWLDESLRKQGLGTKLMRDAEAEAMRRGATMSHLDTFNFQARGFYEKLGYTVFGTLACPGSGMERYYMSKLLAPSTAAAPHSPR